MYLELLIRAVEVMNITALTTKFKENIPFIHSELFIYLTDVKNIIFRAVFIQSKQMVHRGC